MFNAKNFFGAVASNAPQTRFGVQEDSKSQVKRTPLGDISNTRNAARYNPPQVENVQQYQRSYHKEWPETEEMLKPENPPKYKGVEFTPSEEPWFEKEDDYIELDMHTDSIAWPNF